MPVYEKAVSTTTSHTKDDPLVTTWKLTKGIVTEFQVVFHRGARGTTKAIVKRHGTQVFPLNLDEEFKGDFPLPPFETFLPLLVSPHHLKLVTWEEDASFDHEVIFRCVILPPEIALPTLNINKLIDLLVPKEEEEPYPI